ncbi:MAG: hypothetical protein EOP06_32515, partial [Proteobacteria bacterium]
MKPLVVLLGTFALGLLVIKFFSGETNPWLAGRIAMAVMLVFTAVGHFVFVRGMTMMIPALLPFKRELVYLTGGLEVGAAVGLLVPKLQHPTGWGLMLFFLLILPANINAAMNRIDYQKANNEGHDTGYLWFRVPL